MPNNRNRNTDDILRNKVSNEETIKHCDIMFKSNKLWKTEKAKQILFCND